MGEPIRIVRGWEEIGRLFISTRIARTGVLTRIESLGPPKIVLSRSTCYGPTILWRPLPFYRLVLPFFLTGGDD